MYINLINFVKSLNELDFYLLNSPEVIKCSNELGLSCIALLNKFKKNFTWNEEDYFDTEIVKSFVRGILRESEEAEKLTHSLVHKLKSVKKYNSNLNYILKPYPIIHLPNDKFEEGDGMHTDQIGIKKIITAWIPITDYNYPALSTIRGGKISNIFLPWISKKMKGSMVKDIHVKLGSAHIWTGNFLHRGNLNVSSETAAAVIFWISEEPHIDGPAKKLKDYYEGIEKNNSTNFSSKDLEILFQNYNKLISFCLNSSKAQMELNDQIKHCKKFLQDNFNSKDKVFSFGLSLLGQRIHTKLNIEKQKNLLIFLYIFSLLLGAENLSSLNYLIKLMPKKKELITNSLIESDIFSCLPHNSLQWNKIVNLQRNKMVNLKIQKTENIFLV